MPTSTALRLLWDRAALLGLLAMVLCYLCQPERYQDAGLAPAFLLLYVPALVGNYASIPLFWAPASRPGQRIQLFLPSIIVGLIGWSSFVPAASWLVSPLLSLRPDFDPLREVPVLAFYVVAGEVWFYSVHRVIHARRKLYLLLHVHHHRITDPHVINASYQHPLELILITMGTGWAGPLLLSGHASTVALWGALIMFAGNYGHSGIGSIHDRHHRRFKGNYGFLFLDDLLSTARSGLRLGGESPLRTQGG